MAWAPITSPEEARAAIGLLKLAANLDPFAHVTPRNPNEAQRAEAKQTRRILTLILCGIGEERGSILVAAPSREVAERYQRWTGRDLSFQKVAKHMKAEAEAGLWFKLHKPGAPGGGRWAPVYKLQVDRWGGGDKTEGEVVTKGGDKEGVTGGGDITPIHEPIYENTYGVLNNTHGTKNRPPGGPSLGPESEQGRPQDRPAPPGATPVTKGNTNPHPFTGQGQHPEGATTMRRTVDITMIHCGYCHDHHETSDQVRACGQGHSMAPAAPKVTEAGPGDSPGICTEPGCGNYSQGPTRHCSSHQTVDDRARWART